MDLARSLEVMKILLFADIVRVQSRSGSGALTRGSGQIILLYPLV